MLEQMPGQDTVVAGYRVQALIGRGGMGTVYRAQEIESGRLVALKLMSDRPGSDDPGLGARFRNEGRAQASLEHPHVVTVYEAGESEGGLYLAMQLIDGPPLADLIRERELGARRALELLGQVADALDAAHAAGLVHRDVKPRNVLVGAHDHAYLADFGLTRRRAATAMTDSGALLGTVAYLAPEVIQGEEAGPASDRYAFAAMAFECLAGSSVFPRPSDTAVIFAQVNEPPPRISVRRPELGNELDDVFARALAKDPSERPASARELVDAIRQGLERAGAADLGPPPLVGAAALGPDQATDAVVPGTPSSSRAPPQGRRLIVIASLAALAGAAVVACAWLLLAEDGGQPARALSPDRPGLQYIGADLDGAPGRALDCRGRPATPASPPCTVVQSGLPGATIVVPKTGVIRQWAVRGARGELTLAVLRPRDGGAFQVALSATESAGSAGVHTFDTDVPVERGDLVGLVVAPGSAVGVRDGTSGATTNRWLPPVAGAGRPSDQGARTGFDHELLLRVGILPGGRRHSPPQVIGAAAERLPPGRRLRAQSVELDGRTVQLALVQVGSTFALDELVGGRRAARIEVPDLRPRAQLVLFEAAAWADNLAGLDVNFVNEGSARVVQRTYAVTAGGFELLR